MTTTIDASEGIGAPGVYSIDELTYHAHDALSASGAKRLLPPSCPAIFKWERDNGRPEKRAFDFGHAAHSLVLGVGADIVTVDAENWRTKAAREAQESAYAEGKTPLLIAEYARVQDMAAALLEHSIASALLDPSRGTPEQSLFWDDERHGMQRRARLDWLPHATDGRMILADYKSTVCAEPRRVAKSMADFRYHQQAAWYVDGVKALGLAEDVAFVFVFQEKTAPYLVTVVEPDVEALRIGRLLNDRALEVFAECIATDTWPGYTSDVELISLPKWATYGLEDIT